MKNILMINLKSEPYIFKFKSAQTIYEILNNGKGLNKNVLDLIGDSFDHYNIDNQTEENCSETMYRIFTSLLKNQTKLYYIFLYKNYDIRKIEKERHNLIIHLFDLNRYIIHDCLNEKTIFYSMNNTCGKEVYLKFDNRY